LAAGVFAATVEWTAPVVVTGLLLDTVLVAVFFSTLHAILGWSGNRRHPGVTVLVRRSTFVVCVIVAVAAAATASPGLATLFTAGLLITSPLLLDRVLRRLPHTRWDHPGEDQGRMHA
jgi:hypothetical protein